MTRNEYTLKLAEIILADWRKVLLANPETVGRIALPGDMADIMFRALQKAEGMANDFYIEDQSK